MLAADNRGAEGAEIEVRHRVGKGIGSGCPPPNRLGGLGSVVSSPSRVRGRAQAENEFLCI